MIVKTVLVLNCLNLDTKNHVVVVDQNNKLPCLRCNGNIFSSIQVLVAQLTKENLIGWSDFIECGFCEKDHAIYLIYQTLVPEQIPLLEGYVWKPLTELLQDELNKEIISRSMKYLC